MHFTSNIEVYYSKNNLYLRALLQTKIKYNNFIFIKLQLIHDRWKILSNFQKSSLHAVEFVFYIKKRAV